MRTLAYCELEGFAQANLISKMEAGHLDASPIWSDLKTFLYESFDGLVDILIAGYPCQPFSAAGKRAGKEDPRHLWPWIADGIRVLRPRACFFENVEGHISLGLREVVGELESIGYKAAWGIFSASEVGAPHQRKRVFIMAVSDSLGGAAGLSRSLAWNEGFAGIADHGGGEGCGELADADARGQSLGINTRGGTTQDCGGQGYTLKTSGVWPSRPGEPQHGWEPPRVVGNAESRQDHGREPRDLGEEASQGRCGDHAADGTGEAMGNAASQRPQERPPRCNDSPIQATECGGGSEGDRQAQPPLGRDPHGLAGGLDYAVLQVASDNRTEELRLLGNGVVPATAERAFRILWEELQ